MLLFPLWGLFWVFYPACSATVRFLANFVVFVTVCRLINCVDVGFRSMWVSECEELVKDVLLKFIIIFELFTVKAVLNLPFNSAVCSSNAVQGECGHHNMECFL